jgi:hypothetical protein
MLQLRTSFQSALAATLLVAGTAGIAQGTAGGNTAVGGSAGANTNAAAGGGTTDGTVTGGLGSPGAPQGSPGVNSSSSVASPNAVPTLGNSGGIDTSLSQAQSANDPNVATETQQRIGDRVDNRFDWGILGLLGLLGLWGLRRQRRD